MKKAFSIIYFSLILVFSCSFAFPDKLPDWKDINSYLPQKLEFQKTTVDNFQKFSPGIQVYEPAKNIKIMTMTPENTDVFKEINAGFRNNILDWLEFVLNKNISMNKITSIYGFPASIDSKYSEDLDYYDYDTFNISTDKKHIFAKSITIFDISNPAYKNKKNRGIINSEQLNFFDIFPELKPGIMTEEEFKKTYPDLLPYMERKFDINTSYTLTEELEGAKYLYKKAVLKFENGLLSWISLVPVNSDLQTMLKKISDPYKIEKLDKNYDFYIFKNFILVVDRKQKKVINIGLINYDKRF